MWPPPLLRDRPLALQFILAGVLPVLFGVVCGVLLGASGLWFQIVITAGALGGMNAGYEHATLRGGFWRGISGGAVFACALYVTHAVRGVPALATLPLPLPAMAVFYAVMGTPFGVLGAWLRSRRERAATS
jgi:hypothetical protein